MIISNCVYDGNNGEGLLFLIRVQAACVDANNDFTSAAKKFDSQLEASVTKMLKRTDAAGASLPPAPVHVTAHLDPGN